MLSSDTIYSGSFGYVTNNCTPVTTSSGFTAYTYRSNPEQLRLYLELTEGDSPRTLAERLAR